MHWLFTVGITQNTSLKLASNLTLLVTFCLYQCIWMETWSLHQTVQSLLIDVGWNLFQIKVYWKHYLLVYISQNAALKLYETNSSMNALSSCISHATCTLATCNRMTIYWLNFLKSPRTQTCNLYDQPLLTELSGSISNLECSNWHFVPWFQSCTHCVPATHIILLPPSVTGCPRIAPASADHQQQICTLASGPAPWRWCGGPGVHSVPSRSCNL